jgi:hypothetical protein
MNRSFFEGDEVGNGEDRKCETNTREQIFLSSIYYIKIIQQSGHGVYVVLNNV